MSYFERRISEMVLESWRRSRQPARTVVIADLVGKNDRTVREILVRLERRGVIQRRGQRGGWLPRAA